MNMTSIFGSAMTVLAFLIFVGIVSWAYSGRRSAAFRDAANAPFALPDEAETVRGKTTEDTR